MDYREKRALIEQLMDHWEDFYLPSPSGVSTGDGESLGVAFVSGMSRYPSVAELARCLDELAAHQPNHFKHLRGHYSAPWRTLEKPAKLRTASGKMIDSIVRGRARVVPPWVIPRMVDLALVGVAWYWDGRVVLELPPALNRKLREMTDHEGTHLTEAA